MKELMPNGPQNGGSGSFLYPQGIIQSMIHQEKGVLLVSRVLSGSLLVQVEGKQSVNAQYRQEGQS